MNLVEACILRNCLLIARGLEKIIESDCEGLIKSVDDKGCLPD